MKFALPVDDKKLRSDCCQRKTYKVDIKHGKRLYPAVEQALADYIEREINIHIKLEMLKKAVGECPDWNTKAAFNIIDTPREGLISHMNVHSFLNANGYDASDLELIAIIRRIDPTGNHFIGYEDFHNIFEPVILRMQDIIDVRDQQQPHP